MDYGFSGFEDDAFGVILSILIIFFIGLLVVGILYLVSLRNALNAVSPELRRTHPDNVFLMLIPLFNMVYYFIIVGHIADSLGAEMRKRGMDMKNPRPTYGIGLATAILNVCQIIPIINSLAGIGLLVCWIIHWVQVVDAKNKIVHHDGVNILDQGMNP